MSGVTNPKDPGKNRLKRFFLWGIGGTSILLLVGIISFYFLVRSNFFWREIMAPRYFGPYWHTALSWENFTPHVFPPGITFTNIELREPGDDGSVVLTIEEFKALGSWSTRPDFYDLTDLNIRGVNLNLVRHGDSGTNLDRAIARLFEGRPPRPHTRDAISDVPLIPAMMIHQANLEGFVFRLENRTDPGELPWVTRLIVSEPIRMSLQPGVETFKPGRLDEYLNLSGPGRLIVSRGDLVMEAAVEVELDSANLGLFPGNSVSMELDLTPPGKEYPRLEWAATTPLERSLIRAIALPFEDLRIDLKGKENQRLFSLHRGSFDPLLGALDGDIQADFSLPLLVDTISEFSSNGIDPDVLTGLVDERLFHFLGGMEHPVQVAIDTTVSVAGVAQYGAVDPEERMPLSINSQGTFSFNDLVPGRFTMWKNIWGAAWKAEPQLPGTFEARGLWELDASETDNSAGLLLEITAKPTGWEPDRLGVRVMVSDRDDPTVRLRFSPFHRDVRVALSDLFMELDDPLPSLEVFPEYEHIIGTIGTPLIRFLKFLESMDLNPARISQSFQIREPEAMKAFLSPVFGGAKSGTIGNWEIDILHGGPQGFLSVLSSFQFEEIELADLDGSVTISGNAGVVQENERLVFSDFDLKMQRENREIEGEAPFLQVELSRGELTGELGPLAPSFIDLKSGRARFDLTANTMSRQIVEILLRVQTLDISERLSTPFYGKLLDVLGFTPGDPEARGEARVSLSGDLGPVFTLTSQVNLDHLPIRGLLYAQGGERKGGIDRFNARLHQKVSLDRREMLFYPETFDLFLLHVGEENEFARLSLQPDPKTSLYYEHFTRFTDEEVTYLSDLGGAIGTAPLRHFAHSFLDRARRFQRTIHQGGADLVLSLPDVKLVDFRELFEEAGIPLVSGLLELDLRARVEKGRALPVTGAKGNLRLSEVRLEGMDEDLPVIASSLDIRQEGTSITLTNLSSEVRMDPSRSPTLLSFHGEADVSSLASSWRFELKDVNAAIFSVLQRLEDGGISTASRILDAMPSQRLAEIGGEEGVLNLTLEGSTPRDGREVHLIASQTGRSLNVFPRLFLPMSFDLETGVRLLPSGEVLIEKVGGMLYEDGFSDPIVTTHLDQPILLTNESGAAREDARLSISARKNLADFSQRLAEMPLPFYQRAITGGLIDGKLDLLFPGGLLGLEFDRLNLANEFSLSITDLTLEGWHESIDSHLEARIDKGRDAITLSSLELTNRMGGNEVGSLRATASYHLKQETLSGRIDLIDIRGGLLDPLPADLSRWTQQPDAVVNVQADLESRINEGYGDLKMSIRARDIGLPPVPLPDGSDYYHPPLQLDADFLAHYDHPTSRVLLQGFDFFVSGNQPLETSPGTANLDRETSGLLSVQSMGAFALDMRSFGIGEQPEGGSGLSMILGPFQIEDYGPLVRQVAGLPLTKGQLGGHLELSVTETMDQLKNDLVASLQLVDGVWDGQDAREEIGGRLDVSGHAMGRTLEVENLSLRVFHPQSETNPMDHFNAIGSYNTEDNRLRMKVTSDQIDIDRVVRYAGDVQGAFAGLDGGRAVAGEGPERSSSASGPRFLEDLNAVMELEIANMSFREIAFPHLRGRLKYDQSRLELQELISRSGGSLVSLRGDVNFLEARSPWKMDLIVRNLETTPWINSLGPSALHNRIKGKLTADAVVTGRGFRLNELRENLETDLVIRLRDVGVQVPQLEAVLGGEGDVEANLRILIRGNRANFELLTPWNKWRHLTVRGNLRNVLPETGEKTHYSTVARLVRTTPVGPVGRTMEWRGSRVPFRQEVLGVTIEARGVLQDDSGKIVLRNISY